MTSESKPGSNSDWPLVSIVIINSRGGEMFEECERSIKALFYPKIEVIIEENLDKKRTIGQCWNDAVKDAAGDYIFFVGDDDRVSQDYLISLMLYAKKGNSLDTENDIVCYTSYCTAFNDDMMAGQQRIPTGIWKRDYLLKNPFREDLERHVDSEYFERARFNEKKTLVVPHQFGYFYRQHTGKASGEQRMITKDGKVNLTRSPDGGIYIVARYLSFVKSMEKELSKKYNVMIALSYDDDTASESRLIYCDWADESAIKMSHSKLNVPKILRIRSFEAYQDWIMGINYDAFDYVLFVADHVKRYVEERTGYKFGKRARIIPNGVDLEKFKIATDKEINNKIAWSGFLANKKGVQMLLFAARHFPEYEFHVAGSFQQKDVERLFNETKTDNVFYHGFQPDMNAFFADKTYILNTSPREGNPNAVMEGMACGLKPLVYRWVGADEIYGEMTWDTIDELGSLLETAVEPEGYREFIHKNYDFKKTMEKINYIVGKLWKISK